ncbi:MAG TPA: hypothetical protein VKH15_03225 [Candidatus Acidoferrum sp.]|nr:hypothetical protein [Candidatus Acidoferrum sp.]
MALWIQYPEYNQRRRNSEETSRKMGAFSTLETSWQDARYGVRMLRKNPSFTAAAVLTIAIGIGANTAIFTLFDAILLESLPVREPSQLVLFSDSTAEGAQTSTSPPIGQWGRFNKESYEYLKSQASPFESLCAFRSGTATVSVRMPGENRKLFCDSWRGCRPRAHAFRQG